MERTHTKQASEQSKQRTAGGRAKGSKNCRTYKWECEVWDRENGETRGGKYCTIRELNAALGLHLSTDTVWRYVTHTHVDMKQKLGDKAFLKKMEHITLRKINEKVTAVRKN